MERKGTHWKLAKYKAKNNYQCIITFYKTLNQYDLLKKAFSKNSSHGSVWYEAITKSMAQVVASSNLKAAAENEGQALLITKTKAAEAEGNAIKISAEAEKIAAQMRGQGIALFRKEVAKGMSEAANEMKTADLDSSFLLFSMWTEAIKNFATDGKGNVIFLDGSTEGMNKTLKEMMAMNTLESANSVAATPKKKTI